MPATLDISPWLQFGFPAALVVAILAALFFAGKNFLNRYLDQQKAEFDARQQERKQREDVIQEQQQFIKGLAQQALEERKDFIATQLKTAQALEEITVQLSLMNETYIRHVQESKDRLDRLMGGHDTISTELKDLERTVLVNQANYGGGL